jgi:hypothetical protein
MNDQSKDSRMAASILNDANRHHVCAFFYDQDEEFRRLLPYVIDGLAAGEKAIHFVNPRNRDAHRRRLAEAGIDVAAAEKSGQLEVIAGPNGYLEGLPFDQEYALKIIDRLLSEAREKGFRQSRFVGFMDWTEGLRSEELMSFEALVTPILEKHADPVICAYDLSRFKGADVIDIMRTHPAAMIGSVVQHNPFYIPPEEMIEELRRRSGIVA